jgi:hypothetical protein
MSAGEEVMSAGEEVAIAGLSGASQRIRSFIPLRFSNAWRGALSLNAGRNIALELAVVAGQQNAR